MSTADQEPDEGADETPAREDPRGIVEGAGDTVRPVFSVPPGEQPNDQDVQGARILTGFLTRAPFHDYCCRVAERTYTTELPPGMSKVLQLKADHPRLYKASLFADFALRAVVTALLLALACLVLWKALAPFPDFFVEDTQ